MADVLLKSSDPLDRHWAHLAQERVKETLEGIATRRKSVEAMLDRADRLVQDGKIDDATRIREYAVRRFGTVRSLREAMIQRRTGIDPFVKPELKELKSGD